MIETATTSMHVFPLTISPTKIFQWNCCNLVHAWMTVTDDEESRRSDANDPRWRLSYSHHFKFIYCLLRPDNVDNELVGAAIRCAEATADELVSWDGGKAIWAHWLETRDDVIQTINDDQIDNWAEKYFLIKPELLTGITYIPNYSSKHFAHMPIYTCRQAF